MKNSISRPIATKVCIGAAILALLFISRSAFAANVPAQMNYQGQLVNAYGTNLSDGNYTLAFRIYDSPSGGNKLWGDYTTSVPLVGGRFNVALSTDNINRFLPTVLSGQPAAYLEIQVGNNSPITPRQQLLSAPYTLYAGNADTLGGFGWSALFTDTDSPTNGHIPGALIAPNTLTGAQIANGAINTPQLANGAVNTPQLASGAVTAAQIAAGSVGSSQLASGAVLANLQNGSVPASKIVPGSIDVPNLSTNVLNALVPIGTILPFFGSLTNLTPSWMYCNGSIVSDTNSPLYGQQLPDLRQQFLRGADDVNGYPVGSSGGEDYAPDHSHPYEHKHSIYLPTDLSYYSGGYQANGNTIAGGNYYAAGSSLSGLNHEHLVIGYDSAYPEDPNSTSTDIIYKLATDPAGGHDNRPSFISLYYIIRIR
jgi:hypothetical protein